MRYMTIPVLLQFVAGLVLLVKGADWFVDAASAIAHRFGVSRSSSGSLSSHSVPRLPNWW